jgi:chorismate mutase
MQPTDKKTPKRRQPPSQELIELDSRLTSMLVRRAELLSASSSKRRERGGKIADPAQEKALWAVWKERRDESGVDGRIWEQLFNLSNGLAYAKAEMQRQPSGRVRALPQTLGCPHRSARPEGSHRLALGHGNGGRFWSAALPPERRPQRPDDRTDQGMQPGGRSDLLGCHRRAHWPVQRPGPRRQGRVRRQQPAQSLPSADPLAADHRAPSKSRVALVSRPWTSPRCSPY